jgi:ABC-type transport system involved in cytochrome c biogenesis permease subunit
VARAIPCRAAAKKAASAKFAIPPVLIYLAATAILGVNAIGASLPIFGHSPLLLAISALVFGVTFFAEVGSTTAFVRFNYPPSAWPTAIAAMTISFGIGQTVGPTVVGAITDAVGSLSFALNVSAAMLAAGAILSAFQKKPGPAS